MHEYSFIKAILEDAETTSNLYILTYERGEAHGTYTWASACPGSAAMSDIDLSLSTWEVASSMDHLLHSLHFMAVFTSERNGPGH